ncbi:MAG: Fe-S protein assembly co-chaperone HscB [Gemmataceae bacterium]|nr:Fe-S protein assembly co-chaperone HscB [Gemmataceae bacterium]
MDFFQLLAVPKGFGVDLTLLEANFLAASRRCHPDFVGADSQEVLLQSAMVNKAYTTLKDPLGRGEYLLRLEGGSTGESSRVVDPFVLEEIMEARGELDQNPTGGTRKNLLEMTANRMKNHQEQLLNRFRKLEFLQGLAKADTLAEIRQTLNGLRYYQNLFRDLFQGA